MSKAREKHVVLRMSARRLSFISLHVFILLSLVSGFLVKSHEFDQTKNGLKSINEEQQFKFPIEERASLGIQEVAKNAFVSTNQEWEKIPQYQSDPSDEIDQITSLLLMRLYNIISSDTVQSTSDLSQGILNDDSNSHPPSLNNEVISSLRKYVSNIFRLHHDVYYHNYHHTFHVVNNANKLLEMILQYYPEKSKRITPDLTFTFLFSSLIHDVGHLGITNSAISTTAHEFNDKYGSHNQLERNSLSLAFSLFERPEFTPIRDIIFGKEGTESYELKNKSFWVSVTNIILRTDITDITRQKERTELTIQLFHETNADDFCDEKILLLFEHLILISDVGSAFQSWSNFQASSKAIFFEWKRAYETGNLSFDPESDWSVSQNKFLSNYCLGLIQTLNSCGFPKIATKLEKFIKSNIDQQARNGKVEAESVINSWYVTKTRKLDVC